MPEQSHRWWFRLSVAAALLLFAVVVGQDWYRLAPYEPSGWDASDVLKFAAVCALVEVALGVLVFLGFMPRHLVVPALRILATLALAAVAFRLAAPPDFGLDLGRVEVDTERLAGAWLGLGTAAVGAVAAWLSSAR